MDVDVKESRLRFSFPDSWTAEPYDEWAFYRNHFNGVCKSKADDIVACDGTQALYLIEVKDYRRQRRTKPIDIADEIAHKCRDTLAGLAAARVRASNHNEQQAADQSMRCRTIRVVLHLEQPRRPSKLFPRSVDPKSALEKLRKRVRAIDPHPRIVDRATAMPWTVATY
ncbi:MAG: hypothetical protein FKY71_06665 [Spiribacter salinus]|uniref:Cysteinyl-tRNA synthetase n=1 Tax=Spiribacter salinus TaxID=1335746 RepID=A0A540VSU0_9GAMM|nr:MAG: hypothetical protein FKY71_06665 [Spiribacter salinus]